MSRWTKLPELSSIYRGNKKGQRCWPLYVLRTGLTPELYHFVLSSSRLTRSCHRQHLVSNKQVLICCQTNEKCLRRGIFICTPDRIDSRTLSLRFEFFSSYSVLPPATPRFEQIGSHLLPNKWKMPQKRHFHLYSGQDSNLWPTP